MLTFERSFRRIFLTVFLLNGTVSAVAQSQGGEPPGSAVLLIPRGTEQPSFDCEKAKTAAARLICADGELARLDGELGDIFLRQKAVTPTTDQSKFVANQIAWIRKRNENCALKGKANAPIEALIDLKPCIARALRERIGSLMNGNDSSASTLAPNAGDIVVEMSATATQTNPPRITGTTNLPDGTNLYVEMVRTGYGPGCPVPASRGVCWLIGIGKVENGRFSAFMESPLPSIPTGSYTIEISTGTSQPEEVEAVIGKLGQRLRGQYVGLERDHKPKSLRQFLTTDIFEVYYPMTIQIPRPQVTGVPVTPNGSKEKWQQVEGLSANGSGFQQVVAIDLNSIRRDSSDAEASKLGFTSPKISDGRPRMASATVCIGDCAEKSWMRYDCYGSYDNWSESLSMSVRPTSTVGLVAAIACGTAQPIAPRPGLEASPANKPSPLFQKYVAVAATPCSMLVETYGTESFYSLIDPIVQFMSVMENDFGSAINITDYVLTECRLNESHSIQETVTDLFRKKHQGQLPQIPIGGATAEARVKAVRDVFDRWIHHRGPPPDFDR